MPRVRFDILEVTVDDLGQGAVGSKIVAYLQSNPDTNYVEFSFGDLITGVPQVLQSAGLSDKVKLITVAATGQVSRGSSTEPWLRATSSRMDTWAGFTSTAWRGLH